MRTNIEIDDKLMAKAMKATGSKTKREVVERALQTVLQLEAQRDIKKLFGKLKWTGDLHDQRTDY